MGTIDRRPSSTEYSTRGIPVSIPSLPQARLAQSRCQWSTARWLCVAMHLQQATLPLSAVPYLILEGMGPEGRLTRPSRLNQATTVIPTVLDTPECRHSTQDQGEIMVCRNQRLSRRYGHLANTHCTICSTRLLSMQIKRSTNALPTWRRWLLQSSKFADQR